MMHADPLKPIWHEGTTGTSRSTVSQFPALDQRQGADPTWAETMDTLRAPRNRDQKPWEWRRESPIRPVVFHDTGTMDQDVVHLHLEHRVVQRLLGRFTAQGFVHHDLSRACLSQLERRDPARHPDGTALPLRSPGGPAARGAGPGHGPLDRAQPAEASPEPLRPRGRAEDARSSRNRPAADRSGRTSIPSSRPSSARPRRGTSRNCCHTWNSGGRSSPRGLASLWPSGRSRKPPR